MTEHEIVSTESVGLPSGGNYVNLSDEDVSVVRHPEGTTLPTEAGQKAAEQAILEIRGRSFSGRHPELGKMINCQFCGFRHRENELNFHCKQKFATTEDNVVYGELTPPDGLTHLTARQILGAQFFSKKRINSHSNRWAKARANKAAAKQRKKNEVAIEA